MNVSTECKVYVCGSLAAQTALVAIMLWGKRVAAILFMLWLIMAPQSAFAYCHFVTVMGPDGQPITCQVCDHVVICP